MNTRNEIIRDHAGNIILRIMNGNVHDGDDRPLGFIDDRGTFDRAGRRVSPTPDAGLLRRDRT